MERTDLVDFSLTTVTVVETNDQPGRRYLRCHSPCPARSSVTALRHHRTGCFPLSGQQLRALPASDYMLHDARGREIISRTTTLPGLTWTSIWPRDYVLTVMGEGGATGSVYTLALTYTA